MTVDDLRCISSHFSAQPQFPKGRPDKKCRGQEKRLKVSIEVQNRLPFFASSIWIKSVVQKYYERTDTQCDLIMAQVKSVFNIFENSGKSGS